MQKNLILTLCLLLLTATLSANDNPQLFAQIFSNDMILQRDIEITVWGLGNAGADYTFFLTGTDQGQTTTVKADANGRWQVILQPVVAGGPYTMSVSGPEGKQELTDILFGDVWIASGQSNMEWPLLKTTLAEQDIPKSANKYLRQAHVRKDPRLIPYKDDKEISTFKMQWTAASPETVANWTAVGYYFGRDLQKALSGNIPVGIINTSWGGTRVEAWTSRETIASFAGTEKDLEAADNLLGSIDGAVAKYLAAKKIYDQQRNKLEALENDETHQKKYASPDLDDSQWPEINTPGDWDSQGFDGVKGEAWYRKQIDIPAAWAGKDLLISPGAADEIERTFFNGQLVGKTGSLSPFDVSKWDIQRTYTIPGRLVQAGKATIAVRVTNLVGEGGLRSNGDSSYMYIKLADEAVKDKISLAGKWKFSFIDLSLPKLPTNPNNPNTASALYNGMIQPLLQLPIKGAIWYQGESNAGNAYEYRYRFTGMINDWRSRWGYDFPFIWVQLANFRYANPIPDADNWAVVRESQDFALNLPNTATALAIDIGEDKDIHPRDKATVGARLALAAQAIAYGEKDLIYSGPTYKFMVVEGNKIRLSFDHVGSGLVAKDGELQEFAIAGVDKKFVWAKAEIEDDTVVVWSEQVKEPIAVRFAYQTNPAKFNFYNKEGLPALPFRTDYWKVPTQP